MAWLPLSPHRWRRPIAMLTPALLLAGCASLSTPSAPDEVSRAAQQAVQRPYHDIIELGGRLSVRYQQNGSDQAIHGSFNWSQSPERTMVAMLSPLGQTIATIDVTPSQSTLVQAGQPPRTATDVDALAANALGWPLPVSGLREWLQGFALDAAGQRFIASPYSSMNSITTQDGWRIHYASWQNEAAQTYPKRIDLQRSTAQAGDVSIRIVIDNWQPR
jgi:outer membrane lipoprotein LolB